MRIRKIRAEVVLDSKGDSTIGIIVNGKHKGSAPLGVSVGKNEVMPFPENGVPIGLVNRALHNGLKGLKIEEFKDLEEVEKILFDFDGSANLSKIGGNTVIALEYALLRGLSNNNVWNFLNPSADKLPTSMGCCIGGGKHSKEGSDFQEFLLIPQSDSIKDSAMVNKYIYKKIQQDLRPSKRAYTGGWETLLDNVSVLDLLRNFTDEVLEKFGIYVSLGIDVAGSHLFNGGDYFYRKGRISRDNQIKYINNLINRYSIEYIEDPLEENDVNGYSMIKGDLICGDDLICGKIEKLKQVMGKINCISLKPNQIGSLIKIKQLIDYAKENRVVTVMSHRAGETADTMIADLSVAWNTDYIKTGIAGVEHAIKVNRLKQIEKEIK